MYLLIGDSVISSGADAPQAILLDPAYNYMGAFVQKKSDSERYIVDVIFAQQYRNNDNVAPCKVVQYFGGSVCDPSSLELDMFNA